MAVCDMDYCGQAPQKKVWRYPGVPIPHRLSFKYYDPTVKGAR